jgi:hypothetical protein
MSSIKQVNALFAKALKNDGKIDAKEAKHIASVLKKSGVSGAEGKAVAAQIKQHKSEFKSGARKALTSLTTHAKPPPEFPGAKATPAQLQKWEKDMHKFFDDQKAPQIRERKTKNRSAFESAPGRGSASSAATGVSSGGGGSGGTIEDRAAAALGDLKEPKFPGKDANEAELAQFQKDLGKYNRMYEMMSKIMANAHEMKRAIIGNTPR